MVGTAIVNKAVLTTTKLVEALYKFGRTFLAAKKPVEGIWQASFDYHKPVKSLYMFTKHILTTGEIVGSS